MANLTTLGDLKTRACDLADMAKPDTGSDEDQRLTDYANAALSDLWDLLVNSYDDYIQTSTNIAIVAGMENYALPHDFYKLIRVFFTSSGHRYQVHRLNLDDFGGLRTSPIQSGEVEMWYIPQSPRFTLDNELIHIAIPVGWDDFLALSMAVRLVIKEDSDSRALTQEREAARQRIIQMAEPRDTSEADSMSDVSGRWSAASSILSQAEEPFRYRLMGSNIKFIEVEYSGV